MPAFLSELSWAGLRVGPPLPALAPRPGPPCLGRLALLEHGVIPGIPRPNKHRVPTYTDQKQEGQEFLDPARALLDPPQCRCSSRCSRAAPPGTSSAAPASMRGSRPRTRTATVGCKCRMWMLEWVVGLIYRVMAVCGMTQSMPGCSRGVGVTAPSVCPGLGPVLGLVRESQVCRGPASSDQMCHASVHGLKSVVCAF